MSTTITRPVVLDACEALDAMEEAQGEAERKAAADAKRPGR
jgi:hypothetical protein